MRTLAALVLATLAACGGKAPPAEDPGGGGGGGRCTHGEYFAPGCSDEPGLVAGCYERCGPDATCAADTTCTKVTVMPACAMGEGDVGCAACGEEVQLCLPSSVD
jgi:hypothetical protein